MNFNLVVTCEPGKENINWAFSQITDCIGSSYIVVRVRSSLILISVADPYSAWYRLKTCLYGKDTPIHRVIPVDSVVEPIIIRIVQEVQKYALIRIPQDSSFRITLHGKIFTMDGRGKLAKLSSTEAIRMIAEGINRRVDLENPDWVIYIRSVPIKRWNVLTAISVAKAIVFKNIRIGEPDTPL
ncbi:MAG: THUMP domain-containing protein [Ignisphaera sp.]|nr:THUMP domain-containing protein [Ignisphaera sp.]MCX8168136.1 THUMP domain-containing protein [Ignisphaera sp.]MDW8085429.1 THUMP domain-containing protein [Ignisphaera sp.]